MTWTRLPGFCLALSLVFAPTTVRGQADPGEAPVGKLRFYVGTYTGGKSKGIYRCELNSASGELGAVELAGEVVNPSFLALHPNGRHLYAVSEVGEFKGQKGGAVFAFAVAKTGKLTLLNAQSSRGGGPCHLVVDAGGKHVLVANYGGGSVAALPIGKDGLLSEASSFIQHEGSSVDPGRQKGPHAHSINLDPANRFAFVADLGLDKVLVYRFDARNGKLRANDPPSASVAPRSGPRHFAFQPRGRHAYVINEMKNTVTAFRYDSEKGTLKEVQTVTTLPAEFKGRSYTAEVVVHPSGKFLYGSNRGHDSIAAFSIDSDTGKLTPVGHATQKIKTPRNFCIDPTGKFLLVANQGADSIVVFRIDQKTGALSPTSHATEVQSPVCIRFMPPSK